MTLSRHVVTILTQARGRPARSGHPSSIRTSLGLFLLAIAGMCSAQSLNFAPAKSWALLVGAAEYPRLQKLKFADKDAQKMADTLTGTFGFDASTVTVLNDRADSTKSPTRKNILASLNLLLGDSNLNRGDLFVFYFSGHGLATSKGDFLCPVDLLHASFEVLAPRCGRVGEGLANDPSGEFAARVGKNVIEPLTGLPTIGMECLKVRGGAGDGG